MNNYVEKIEYELFQEIYNSYGLIPYMNDGGFGSQKPVDMDVATAELIDKVANKEFRKQISEIASENCEKFCSESCFDFTKGNITIR